MKSNQCFFILRLIDCCMMIHKLMIPDDETLTDDLDWYGNDGDVSDVDEESRAPIEFDRLNRHIPQGCRKDERRCRLQTYLEYKEYCPNN